MSGRGPAALDPAAAVAGGPPAEWSRAAVAVRGRGLVHARFAAQARRRPDAPALIGPEPGAPPLTYGELAARVRRLAAHLRALGVGPGVLVAIHAERSARTVEAILAVLAAGGAYLPLDPGYPRERLAFMLEDSRAAVLLTREGLAAELPAGRA
ncbi:MAG TPA: AMP-binding protein, partial [Thermoanaerobaculia bacterium]|nr:AMP-binding protein [Thermoanaerobaculia bacterium]